MKGQMPSWGGAITRIKKTSPNREVNLVNIRSAITFQTEVENQRMIQLILL